MALPFCSLLSFRSLIATRLSFHQQQLEQKRWVFISLRPCSARLTEHHQIVVMNEEAPNGGRGEGGQEEASPRKVESPRRNPRFDLARWRAKKELHRKTAVECSSSSSSKKMPKESDPAWEMLDQSLAASLPLSAWPPLTAGRGFSTSSAGGGGVTDANDEDMSQEKKTEKEDFAWNPDPRFSRSWLNTKLQDNLASAVGSSSEAEDCTFTLMSYNVLADKLMQGHRELYRGGTTFSS